MSADPLPPLAEIAERLEARAAGIEKFARGVPAVEGDLSVIEDMAEAAALDRLVARALRGCDAALEPFDVTLSMLETQGTRGTWACSQLDAPVREDGTLGHPVNEYTIHDWKGRATARSFPDDLAVLIVIEEMYGGSCTGGFNFGHLRRARQARGGKP